MDETKHRHRDWIARVVATLSFIISVGSFGFTAVSTYYGVIIQKDDLRVVFDHSPFVTLDQARNELVVAGELRTIFVNSGNRPAVVVASRLFVQQGPERKDVYMIDECGGTEIPVALAPFSIKEKDVVSKTFDLRPNAGFLAPDKVMHQASNTGEYRVPIDENFTKSLPNAGVITCIRLIVTTPSVAQATKDFPMNQFTFGKDGTTYIDTSIPVAPMAVVQHTGTIFSD